MQQNEVIQLLVQAHASVLGVKVRTTNPQLLRNKLYAAMREYPALSGLGIVSPPVGSDTYLWLVKKEQKDATPED